MKLKTTFAKAINDGIAVAMEKDPNVICYGLGTDDPLGVFGTTLGLQERFGKQRVFDMPTSENAMTGVAIGASLNGIRSVITHQRLDFFLLAMDQLVNNAAKWHYMFGGQVNVPMVIRLIIGRGWGQGPTHSQSLHAWFAHIPGLKVVMPTTAADAKGLLLSSIFDDNPVVFLEHRWLHNQEGVVPKGDVREPLGKAKLLHKGNDLSIVSMSYMTVEALHAVTYLESKGISCDVLDLRTISPLDWEMVFNSVRKTGRLLVLDTSSKTCSIASEVIARCSSELFNELKTAPQILTLPDFPTPTSLALTENYYHRSEDIVAKVENMLGIHFNVEEISFDRTVPHDIPGDWFKGPF